MTDRMDDIERDLSQSRENLKDSVSALGEKLTFGQLIDEVIEKSGFDVSSAKAALGDAAKLTIPGAVLGAGVALLVANLGALKRSGVSNTKHNGNGYDFSADWRAQEQYRTAASLEGKHARAPEEDETSYRKRLRTMQAEALGYKREPDEPDHSFHARIDAGLAAAKSAAQEAGARLANAAKATANGAMGMAGAVKHTASGAARRTSDAAASIGQGVKSGAERAQAMYDENPVLGVAVGVCVGAILGSLVPLTRKEQEVLGEPVAKAAAAVAEAGERAAQDIGRGVRAAGAEHRQPNA